MGLLLCHYVQMNVCALIKHQLADFHETWYENHETVGHPLSYILIFTHK